MAGINAMPCHYNKCYYLQQSRLNISSNEQYNNVTSTDEIHTPPLSIMSIKNIIILYALYAKDTHNSKHVLIIIDCMDASTVHVTHIRYRTCTWDGSIAII